MGTSITVDIPIALASLIAPVVFVWCAAYLVGFRRGQATSSDTDRIWAKRNGELKLEIDRLLHDRDSVRAEIHAFGQRFAASRGDASVKPRAN